MHGLHRDGQLVFVHIHPPSLAAGRVYLAGGTVSALPWVRAGKEYLFDTDAGVQTLADLFDGRSQLLVYHFRFGPDWTEGCPICSSWADNFNGGLIHTVAGAGQWPRPAAVRPGGGRPGRDERGHGGHAHRLALNTLLSTRGDSNGAAQGGHSESAVT
jgi:Bacterial protein of unknown function (DUF899)